MSIFDGVGFYNGTGDFNLKLTMIFIIVCAILVTMLKDCFLYVFNRVRNTSFWKYKIVRNVRRLYYLLCCSKITIKVEVHKHCSVIKVDSNMDEVEIIDAVYKELD